MTPSPADEGGTRPDDPTTVRLRNLAEHWQRDPGVTVWADLLPGRAVTALTEDTAMLPIVTPARRMRGEGGGWR